MRFACRAMISRNRARLLGLRRHLVLQRLDVALDGRERRAQLVRDVGHEVAAHAIGVAQVRDVVQHEHRARRALGA